MVARGIMPCNHQAEWVVEITREGPAHVWSGLPRWLSDKRMLLAVQEMQI